MRGLPPIPTIGKQAMPYKPRKAPVAPKGPREFIFPEEFHHTGGPGEVPAAFVAAKTSATEWPPYWGLARIFGQPSPRIVREPPYMGAPGIWEYQQYIAGNVRTTNIDFVVLPANGLAKPTAFRVQTEFVHNFPEDGSKYIYDIQQRNDLEGMYDVVDLYDYQFLGDSTGEAIIKLLKAGMGLIEQPNPIVSGVVQRVPS